MQNPMKMLIIVDKRIPDKAKQTLAGYGEVLEFATQGITYETISGHPDIFFCQTALGLVIAPNTPAEFLRQLEAKDIPYTPGEKPVCSKYPETARYNAVVTNKYLIHNTSVTDGKLLELLLTFDILPLTFRQAYTRCNLIALGEHHFITSDRGIKKALNSHNLDVLYVSPEGIILPGFPNGFFGGCCGVWEDKLLITGSLNQYAEGEKVWQYSQKAGFQVIELYDGPLFDVGGILFINYT
jgi:hypothetical protein